MMFLGDPSGDGFLSTMVREPMFGGPMQSMGGAEPGAERL